MSGAEPGRAAPLVSCLCVTEGRSAFLPWLRWGFERQTWPHKELLIVDSSPAPAALPMGPQQRIVQMPPGSSVPDKRNRALAEARGELVAWFDDDDWQHPERLSQLVALLPARRGAVWAGPRSAWLLDLGPGEAWRLPELESGVLFNGSVLVRDFARQYAFDTRRQRASDTVWMTQLLGRCEAPPIVVPPNFFWLFHGRNLSLRPRRTSRATAAFAGPFSLTELRASVGAGAWADTDVQLAALRDRLAAEQGLRGAGPV